MEHVMLPPDVNPETTLLVLVNVVWVYFSESVETRRHRYKGHGEFLNSHHLNLSCKPVHQASEGSFSVISSIRHQSALRPIFAFWKNEWSAEVGNVLFR